MESEGVLYGLPSSLKIEYPFVKHIPIAFVMSISHVSGCAMICRKKTTRHHQKKNRFGLWFVLSSKERETVGYKCRVAPGMAITGNGANDTPVQSQVERDKTVATNEGSR